MKPQISLKARALRYLSMREHSRVELARKLGKYATEATEVEQVLDWLEAAEYLSTQRFSDSLVNRRAARFGNQRIISELKLHAIDTDDMARIKLQLNETEAQRALEVLQRKFPDAPADQNDRAKQQRFLMQRGFTSQAIHVAMKRPQDNDD